MKALHYFLKLHVTLSQNKNFNLKNTVVSPYPQFHIPWSQVSSGQPQSENIKWKISEINNS